MTPPHDPNHLGYGWKHPVLGGLGVVIAVGIIAFIDDLYVRVWLIGSFGSSAAMIFGFPDSAFVQPRNVIVGHVSAAAVGWMCTYAFGPTWWSVAIGCGLALTVMMLLRSSHPPATGTPIVIHFLNPGPEFILVPVAVGALILVATAFIYNNAVHKRPYPKHWW